MAIIVEDGTIVAGANSYITVADARTFLTQFGQDLPVDNDEAEAALISAFYYLNGLENKYQGSRVDSAQTGSFPRSGVYVNGFAVSSSEIPIDLINAQCFAAYEEGLSAGILTASLSGKSTVMKEVVGAVKVQYSDNGAIDGSVSYPRINSSLNPLYKNNTSAFQVPSFRG
jgi:hypothetical protein